MHYSKVKFRRKITFSTGVPGPFSKWFEEFAIRTPGNSYLGFIKLFEERELQQNAERAKAIFASTFHEGLEFEAPFISHWDTEKTDPEIELTQESATYLLLKIIDSKNVVVSKVGEDPKQASLIENITLGDTEMLLVEP